MAAPLVKVGTYELLTTDSGTVDITDVGFEPKLMIFFGGTNWALSGYNDNIKAFVGATDGTNEYATMNSSRDGQDTSDTTKCADNSCIKAMWSTGAGFEFDYSFNSWLSNGIRLDVNTAPGNDSFIGYIAIGGAGLANVHVGTKQIETSTGSKSVTSATFTGNALITFGMGGTSLGTRTSMSHGFVGFATASDEEACVTYRDQDGVDVTQCDRQMLNDAIMVELDGTGAIKGEADFTAFTATGFTYNVSDAFPSGKYVMYIILDVDEAEVGEFTLSDTLDEVFSVDMVRTTPSILLLSTGFNTDYNSASGCDVTPIAGTDGTNEVCVQCLSSDGVDTSNTKCWTRDTCSLQRKNQSDTTNGKIEIQSFSNGKALFKQTDASATATEKVFFLALGVPITDVAANLHGNFKNRIRGGFQ